MSWLKAIIHSALGCVLVSSVYYLPKPKVIELLYNYTPYVFIHIPKNGGSAVNKWIKQSQCPYISKVVHEETAKSTLLFGQQPIAIIRHPVDRFISNYYYWKHGSEDIKPWQRTKEWRKADHIHNIHDFIYILSHKSHPLHLHTKRQINTRDHYTWLHFLAQSYWIGKNEDKTHIICYHHTALQQHIQRALDNLGIPCKVTLNKVNISMHKANQSNKLTKKEQDWIANEYAEDMRLWQRHCQKLDEDSIKQAATP